MSGDKPLWFRLWKQILPKMEEFHYTSARDVASDLNYKVLDNTKELEAAAESVGASGGTIDVPIRFSKTKYLGAAVHDIYFSSDFSVKDVSYSGGSPMSVAYRGCQIESEKDRLLSLLTATVKVDGRGGASLAGTNDTDNDCVINSIEDLYGLKKGSDTFEVLKKYRKLRGHGRS